MARVSGVFSSVTRTLLYEVGSASQLTAPAAACPGTGGSWVTRGFPGAWHMQSNVGGQGTWPGSQSRGAQLG